MPEMTPEEASAKAKELLKKYGYEANDAQVRALVFRFKNYRLRHIEKAFDLQKGLDPSTKRDNRTLQDVFFHAENLRDVSSSVGVDKAYEYIDDAIGIMKELKLRPEHHQNLMGVISALGVTSGDVERAKKLVLDAPSQYTTLEPELVEKSTSLLEKYGYEATNPSISEVAYQLRMIGEDHVNKAFEVQDKLNPDAKQQEKGLLEVRTHAGAISMASARGGKENLPTAINNSIKIMQDLSLDPAHHSNFGEVLHHLVMHSGNVEETKKMIERELGYIHETGEKPRRFIKKEREPV
jgi:hypothetical protein